MKTIGIIGFGRFGRFWAELLARDFPVWAADEVDRSAEAAAAGVNFAGLADVCAHADTLFLCVPINSLVDVAAALQPHVRPGTTLIDTCSVKRYPARVLREQFGSLEKVSLLAGHPMFGPDSAGAGLDGLPLVLWPLQDESGAYSFWRRYFHGRGLKLVEISPDEHDQLAAYSQGVTHYIGRVLGELDLEETAIDTQGFQILRGVIEQTCNDSWELFHDIQNYNPYTREMRLRLEAALDQVYARLLPERVSAEKLHIGIQGGRGSFNEEACRHLCRREAIDDFDIHYLHTSANVLGALHRGEIDRGIFAIQSAKGGVVMESVRALSEYNCEILDIFEIVIDHCLLLHPQAAIDSIDTLISHPQALAQCAGTLAERYPQLALTSGQGEQIDQALCARHLAEGDLPPSTAVLAPRVCADLFGLAVHDCGLQDYGRNNRTTFAWVKRRGIIVNN